VQHECEELGARGSISDKGVLALIAERMSDEWLRARYLLLVARCTKCAARSPPTLLTSSMLSSSM